MKNIILAVGLSVGLVGCASSPIADAMSSAKTSVSSFDGSKEISTRPMYAFATSGFHASPIFLGAMWTDKLPDKVSLNAEIQGKFTNINNLYLNIDGDIKKYQAIQSSMEFGPSNSQTYAQRSSIKRFIVPVSDIERIKIANSVKVKVTTPSSYFEGVIVSDGKLSPAAKSLINVIDGIEK